MPSCTLYRSLYKIAKKYQTINKTKTCLLQTPSKLRKNCTKARRVFESYTFITLSHLLDSPGQENFPGKKWVNYIKICQMASFSRKVSYLKNTCWALKGWFTDANTPLQIPNIPVEYLEDGWLCRFCLQPMTTQ